MVNSKFKRTVFVLEGLNAFATGFYFNWIFFYTKNTLQFRIEQNLGLVALHGLIYTIAAWFGGWFGHHYGGFRAVKIGFATMIAALVGGAFTSSPLAQLFILAGWTFGMCFTWPTFQTWITLGEKAAALPRLAGIYNIVWAGIAALSFFIGGTLIENLGVRSIFVLPSAIHLLQFVLVSWAEKTSIRKPLPSASENSADSITPKVEDAQIPSANRKLFLRLALVANPIAYVAINTVIPTIPEVAKRFELSPMWAGFLCSIWFFIRLGAFILFWLWPGWHYRFRWLVTAQLALVISFVALLRATQLWMLVGSQIVFGLSIGLIYYSSLFYSMNGGTAESKNSGIHESMIGFGTGIGAAAGATAKLFWPNIPGISTFAVGGLLFLGFVLIVALRLRHRVARQSHAETTSRPTEVV